MLAIALSSVILFASSISLVAEMTELTQNDRVTVQMEVVEDNEGDFKNIPMPHFSAFTLLQQGESSSRSVSIVNGSMTSKTVKTYTYLLSPNKQGRITIPPVKATLEKGRVVKSNSLSFRIGKAVSSTANPLAPAQNSATQTQSDDEIESDDDEQEDALELATEPNFATPLSKWEARNRRYFIRVFVRPLGSQTPFQGMTFEISYYLYTRRGAVGNIDVPQFPAFKNSWVEEAEKPTRLSFKSVQIKNSLYDYALLKRYLVIPESSVKTLEATQMIVAVAGRGFFARQKNISSIALSIPLVTPEDAASHKDAVFGSFTVIPSKLKISLTAGHLIDSLSYTISGCGNFSALDLALKPHGGLKIFPPDVKSEAEIQNGQYCGEKTFTFMLKGLKKGSYSLELEPFEQFDGSEYKRVSGEAVAVDVEAVAITKSSVASEKEKHSFEFLPTLPKSVVTYKTGSIFNSLLVMALVLLPTGALLVALLMLLFSARTRRNKASRLYRQKQLFAKIDAADSATELLNRFYEAFSEIHTIDLKGIRKQELEQNMGDDASSVYLFIESIQSLIYSGQEKKELLSQQKEAAKKEIVSFGVKK